MLGHIRCWIILGIRSLGVRSLGVLSLGVRSLGVRYVYHTVSISSATPLHHIHPSAIPLAPLSYTAFTIDFYVCTTSTSELHHIHHSANHILEMIHQFLKLSYTIFSNRATPHQLLSFTPKIELCHIPKKMIFTHFKTELHCIHC